MNQKTKEKIPLLSTTWFVTLAALFCCLLWGSAFPCIKIGYRLFEIAQNDIAGLVLFAGIRFTFAGVLVILFTTVLQRRFVYPKRSSLGSVFKLSLAQTAGQYTLFYIGMANTTAVRSSIIGGSSVFISILFAVFIFKQEYFTKSKLAGCILGFAGIVVMNLGGLNDGGNAGLIGDACILFSNVSYALSSAMMGTYSKKEDPMILSGYQFVAGGLIMIIAGLSFGGRIYFSGSFAHYSLLFYLAFLSAAAYSIWGLLLKYNPVSKVMMFFFATPVFGTLLSGIILNDYTQLKDPAILFSLVMICTGILIVNRKKSINTIL